MKKVFAIIPAAVLALGAFTGMGISASASCHSRSNTNSCHSSVTAKNYGWNTGKSSVTAVNTQAKTRHYFIDSNNDGICDSCTGGICLSNGLCSGYYHDHGIFIDNNHDGICDHYAAGVCSYHHINGKFIDNNNDGICDNCGSGVCLSNGLCGGSHHLNGYFIDNNHDGICDSCAAGICAQHGTGLGHHSGHGCH